MLRKTLYYKDLKQSRDDFKRVFNSDYDIFIDLENVHFVNTHKIDWRTYKCNDDNCLLCKEWLPVRNLVFCDIVIFTDKELLFDYILMLDSHEYKKLFDKKSWFIMNRKGNEENEETKITVNDVYNAYNNIKCNISRHLKYYYSYERWRRLLLQTHT